MQITDSGTHKSEQFCTLIGELDVLRGEQRRLHDLKIGAQNKVIHKAKELKLLRGDFKRLPLREQAS